MNNIYSITRKIRKKYKNSDSLDKFLEFGRLNKEDIFSVEKSVYLGKKKGKDMDCVNHLVKEVARYFRDSVQGNPLKLLGKPYERYVTEELLFIAYAELLHKEESLSVKRLWGRIVRFSSKLYYVYNNSTLFKIISLINLLPSLFSLARYVKDLLSAN